VWSDDEREALFVAFAAQAYLENEASSTLP